MGDDRRHLGGAITPESYEGWHLFARAHGVSVVALLEGLGLWLAEQDTTPGRLPAPWRSVIAEGRALDSHRKRR